VAHVAVANNLELCD